MSTRGEIDLGVTRIKQLLALLGNPHQTASRRAKRVFHVTGTNGKGSVATALAVKMSHVCKVGLFTSPAYLRVGDNICVYEGGHASRLELASLQFRQLRKMVISLWLTRSLGALTEFEIETSIAFLMFDLWKCDSLVVEVGMGGLRDATNVFSIPTISVITSISLDHQVFLGNSVEEISREKCGIFKKGGFLFAPVWLPESVRSVIKSEAESVGVEELIWVEPGNSFSGDCWEGTYQESNLAIANRILNYFEIPVDNSLGPVRPGRMQRLVINGRATLLDGAHNEEGLIALTECLHGIFLNQRPRIIWLVAFSNGKQNLVEHLPISENDKIICTEFSAVELMPWVVHTKLEDLILSFEKKFPGFDTTGAVSLQEAISLTENSACSDALLVVCGSLYLIREFLNTL